MKFISKIANKNILLLQFCYKKTIEKYFTVYFNKNDCPNNLNEGQENENVTIMENIQSDKNESFEPTDTQKTKSITKNKTKSLFVFCSQVLK